MPAVYDAGIGTIRQWVRWFKDGEVEQTDVSDKPRSGRPMTSGDWIQQDHVEELIHRNDCINSFDIRLLSFSGPREGNSHCSGVYHIFLNLEYKATSV